MRDEKKVVVEAQGKPIFFVKNMPSQKPLMIIKRTEPDEHYEVHFIDRIEFWDMSLSVKQGTNQVHRVD